MLASLPRMMAAAMGLLTTFLIVVPAAADVPLLRLLDASPAAPATKLAGMPQIGLGTYHLQGQACYDAVLRALQMGYRHLDTAEVYGNHEAVRLAIRDSGVPRDELFVTSKVKVDQIDYESARASASRIAAALGGHVDLLLLHFPAPSVAADHPNRLVVWTEIGGLGVEGNVSVAYAARAGAWRALEEAWDAGLCRHVGVSNYLARHLREMRRYARVRAAVDQLELHPLLPRDGVVDFGRRAGVAVVAYGSVVQEGRRDLLESAAVRAAAAAAGRSPAAALLRWAADRGIAVIPRSTDGGRLAENLAAVADDWRLDGNATAALDALRCDRGTGCLAPFPTGCGLHCPRGQYLWSPDVVPALPTVLGDATEAAAAPFVEDLGVRTPLGAEPVADLSQRHKPRGAPLWRLPWVFDLAALRRDVRVALEGWDWAASEFGHARPLLPRAALPPAFRDHFINRPHADAGLFDRCPYLAKVHGWFAARTEVVAFRLLRRRPLTAYGLHNDEDLHVTPDIRRVQIPVDAEVAEGLLLLLPEASFLPVIAARGADFAATNALLNQHAYPECQTGPPGECGDDRADSWWAERNSSYDAERLRLEALVADFAELGAVHELEPGRLHYFDTMRRHTLVNMGTRDRVTLVLDLRENDWVREHMPALRARDDGGLAARAAAARAYAAREGFLGAVSIDEPARGALLADGSVELRLGVRFPSTLHLDAFEALCGGVLGKAQVPGSACAAAVTQVDRGSAGLGDATAAVDVLTHPQNAALDTRRCAGGQACELRATITFGDGTPAAAAATVEVYLRDVDTPTFFDATAAAALSALAFSNTHGAATGGFLGTGLLYHALAYSQRARLAVVLGSGGGFAPAAVRQGQRDAGIGRASRTILVDGNVGPYGRPDYLVEGSAFRHMFPDIEVVVARTDDEALDFGPIDLLLVDADHSHAGAVADAVRWAHRLAPSGVAVLHDTGGWRMGCAKAPATLRRLGFDVVNLPSWGDGLALARPPRAPGGTIIDVNGGRGLDELYAELDAGADVAEFAARACLTRGWSTLPGDDSGRPCAVALADAARGTGEVDALRELRASVDARLAALGAAPACAEDEAPTGT